MKEAFYQASESLSEKLYRMVQNLPEQVADRAEEISLRAGRSYTITSGNQTYFVKSCGGVVSEYRSGVYVPTLQDCQESFLKICDYSIHSCQEDIRQGFVTIRGGHRAGLCGTAVRNENNQITALREISSIRIRIARAVEGVSKPVTERLFRPNPIGLLVAGPPGSGKTTLLRDIAYSLASAQNGKYYRVCVVDERSELGGCHNGLTTLLNAPCCDLMDGYPKQVAILQATRSLCPEVMICDEVGTLEECNALATAVNSGVVVIASVHAGNREDLIMRPQIRRLMDTGAFEQIVLLSGYDYSGVRLQTVSRQEYQKLSLESIAG